MSARSLGLGFFMAASSLGATEWLVEDFEAAQGKSGPWGSNFDDHKLGTTFMPSPFKPAQGQAGQGKGYARIWGHLGLNQAPWSWARLQIDLSKDGSAVDLSSYKSLRFLAKGDGLSHSVRLVRKAVEDGDQFFFSFPTTLQWQEVSVPISAFKQAGWGRAQAVSFADVLRLEFGPQSSDEDFELSLDQVFLSDREVVLKPIPYDTQGWFPYQGVDLKARKGTALDASGILDAPAGKYGWLKPQGEDFVFEKTGKPIRFFGVNIVAGANFPSHDEAERAAEFLAQMGVNITRHHHGDAPWSERNFFGKGPSTRKLDPESMDRFDYFIAELQKRGIYQYFDLLVHREPKAADGVEDPKDVGNGFKLEGEFAPDLIALEKEFTGQLLGHVNPYTKKAYGQDPAIAMMEIINEDSLLYRQEKGEFAVEGGYYSKLIDGLFGGWLVKKYGSASAAQKAWQEEGKSGISQEDDWSRGIIRSLPPASEEAGRQFSKARLRDNFEFHYRLQEAYYDAMKAKAREMGYQGPVTGSNHWIGHPADMELNARMGYLDRHDYWAHPRGGWGYDTKISWDNTAMVKSRTGGVIGSLASRRVKGVPYIVTEWQLAAPNDYRQEGLLWMGAYCLFQNWSAIQFAFGHSQEKYSKRFNGPLDSNFDIINQPSMLALWPLVSRMLARGDFQAPQSEVLGRVAPASLFDPNLRNPVPPKAGLAMKTGLEFSAALSDNFEAALSEASKEKGWLQSKDGQIRHNPGLGQFVLDTPRSQAFSGFGKSAQTRDLRLNLKNSFATVMLSSLDGLDLASSKSMLLAAAGNAVNSGQSLMPSRSELGNAGKAPVLVEPIEGEVALLGGASKVYALDSSGRRGPELPLRKSGNSASFVLSRTYKALHYEILR